MQIVASPASLPTITAAPAAANVRPANSTTAQPELSGNSAFAPVAGASSSSASRTADTYQLPRGNATQIASESTQAAEDDVRASSTGSDEGVSSAPDSQGKSAPEAEAANEADGSASDAQQQAEIKQIQQLKQRDAEVRAHEQAHAAVGGNLAGAASFSYQRGPDGVRYAVGGEVSIDVSKVSGDPQATLEKMERVRRAALAPAEPSAQDRQVAAQAAQLAAEARLEMAAEQRQLARQQSSASEAERQEVRAELQEAREKQRAAEEKAEKEEEPTVSAAERFAEYNAKVRRINETLLRISQPSPITAGQLLNDIA
ncbi:hypothetical protein GCM10011297_21370 [Bacterioplanes sanyensis]|uniref:putative metalloprotease CJM1_0395 family protein n=1 Tax=Bacterioplanes sanyensis TaxID=1249553 RepID=UPI00167A4B46|nr:putative metalloprotease CJM1_0395 family protein [Bacterioplanes sanyensis]GGY48178.1 hypothetical protein GCM10011297_21370 [Bacterioplanes sanyensis]